MKLLTLEPLDTIFKKKSLGTSGVKKMDKDIVSFFLELDMLKKIKKVIYKAVTSNHSPSKLASSFAIGLYISFSPIPGGHTIMMLTAKWLFKLNLPVLLLGSTINNPWTMVPFFIIDYGFGYWLLHTVLGFNPAWNISLAKVFGSGSICFWSFFVGGNILGVAAALISYPLMLALFKKILNKVKTTQSVQK